MATLIKTDGTEEGVTPADGKEFTLEELQGYVGGYIEMLTLPDGALMLFNEDGLRLELEPNKQASDIAAPYDVVGPALRLMSSEMDGEDEDDPAEEAPPTTSLSFTDTDLWGLYSVLEHAKREGYLGENNAAWGEAMQLRIYNARLLLAGEATDGST